MFDRKVAEQEGLEPPTLSGSRFQGGFFIQPGLLHWCLPPIDILLLMTRLQAQYEVFLLYLNATASPLMRLDAQLGGHVSLP